MFMFRTYDINDRATIMEKFRRKSSLVVDRAAYIERQQSDLSSALSSSVYPQPIVEKTGQLSEDWML
jgi:hypothetical protein